MFLGCYGDKCTLRPYWNYLPVLFSTCSSLITIGRPYRRGCKIKISSEWSRFSHFMLEIAQINIFWSKNSITKVNNEMGPIWIFDFPSPESSKIAIFLIFANFPLFCNFSDFMKNLNGMLLVFWPKFDVWTTFCEIGPLAKQLTIYKWSKIGPKIGVATPKMVIFEP